MNVTRWINIEKIKNKGPNENRNVNNNVFDVNTILIFYEAH